MNEIKKGAVTINTMIKEFRGYKSRDTAELDRVLPRECTESMLMISMHLQVSFNDY
jgi:hypothetical protein